MELVPIEDTVFEKIPKNIQPAILRNGGVRVADPIMPLWCLPKGTTLVVLIGGRGGMKTYGVSEFIAYQSAVNKKRCIILRDEKVHAKDSILNEILDRYDGIPFNTSVEKMHTGLKDKENSKDLVFTKGFKASSNQKRANMKGISDIDFAVIEEAEDIVDSEKYNSFVDSLRKDGCIVIVLMNTPDIGHFILKNYFNVNIPAPVPQGADPKDYDGYFDITPKQVDGFVCIKTGFEQNKYLPRHIIDRYNSYGDHNSNIYNLHYYLTAIKGYASTGRKGQVFKKIKPISLKEYLELPFREYYGQDFGTASPAGMVGVKFDKENVYCREINYSPMNVLEIAKLYCKLGLTKNDMIVADSADKISCDKLEYGFKSSELDKETIMEYTALIRGFFIRRCKKGDGSINAGIALIDGLNAFAVQESENLWAEIRNYSYAQDKNGNYINIPEDKNNHVLDPLRYVVNEIRGAIKIFGL